MLQVSEDKVELRGRLFHDHMVSSGLQENRTCWDQERLEAPFLVSGKLGTQRSVVRAGASNCTCYTQDGNKDGTRSSRGAVYRHCVWLKSLLGHLILLEGEICHWLVGI